MLSYFDGVNSITCPLAYLKKNVELPRSPKQRKYVSSYVTSSSSSFFSITTLTSSSFSFFPTNSRRFSLMKATMSDCGSPASNASAKSQPSLICPFDRVSTIRTRLSLQSFSAIATAASYPHCFDQSISFPFASIFASASGTITTFLSLMMLQSDFATALQPPCQVSTHQFGKYVFAASRVLQPSTIITLL